MHLCYRAPGDCPENLILGPQIQGGIVFSEELEDCERVVDLEGRRKRGDFQERNERAGRDGFDFCQVHDTRRIGDGEVF